MKVLLDTRPLRQSRPFARLWGSALFSGVTGQLGTFAVTFEIWRMTQSTLAVGLIGFAVGAPTMAFALWGGALADKFDKRTIMIAAAIAQAGIASVFMLQAALALQSVFVLYGLVFAQASVGAIAVPARRAALRSLVPVASVPSALILSLVASQLGQFVGPAVGGFVYGSLGPTVCFSLQLVGVLGSLAAAFGLPSLPGVCRPGDNASSCLRLGLVSVVRSPVLRGAFLADLSLTVLCLPTALLPAINESSFGGTAESLGVLLSCLAAGGIAASLLSGFVSHTSALGRGLIVSCCVWAILVIGFGLSANLWQGMAALVLIGAADTYGVTFGQALIQLATPGEIRGRVAGLEHVVQMGGPQIGGLRAGAVGSVIGPQAAIVVGSLAALGALAAICGTNRPLLRARRDSRLTEGQVRYR